MSSGVGEIFTLTCDLNAHKDAKNNAIFATEILHFAEKYGERGWEMS